LSKEPKVGDVRGDLAQLLAALRSAPDQWSRVKLIAGGARALAKLTPAQRVQLLRQLGLQGAEELAEAAVGGDPRVTEAMTQALRALESDPRRVQQLAAAIADPSSRRATLMGLGAHVIEAVTTPAATPAKSTPTKGRGTMAAVHPGAPQPATPQPPQPSTPQPPQPGTPTAPPSPPPAPAIPHPHPTPAQPPAPPAAPPSPSTPQPSPPSPPAPSTPTPSAAPVAVEPSPATEPTPSPPPAPPEQPASPTSVLLATAPPAWEPEPIVAMDTSSSSGSSIGATTSLATAASPRPAALDALRAWHRRLAAGDMPDAGDAAALIAEQLRPDWARRRAISALFAHQEPAALDDALALVAQVSSNSGRRWVLADLAASRAWADAEWQRLLAAAATPAERRRLSTRRLRA